MSELNKWLDDIKRDGRAGWIRYYKDLLHRPLSSPDKFWNALDQYGEHPLFEAVYLTANAKIKGDPLNYVLAVAGRKWEDERKLREELDTYWDNVQRVRMETAQRNAELALKLQRARKMNADQK